MTIGSLFSGIGGLELGLEWAGLGPVVWQVEQDAFCRDILAKHWPHARRFGDVRTVGADLPRVDVLCGGFPCQDVSLAGAGAGLAGARSGLWYEYLRIIAEIRPRGVVIENVAGLVRRGLDVVVGGLCDLGYAVEGARIRASDLGAPHRRERVFLVAYADREGRPQPGGRVAGQRGWALDGGEGGDLGDTRRSGLEVDEPQHPGQQPAALGAGRADGPGSAIAGLGIAADGLLADLDRAARAHGWPGWPAGRGAEQYDYEPPRTGHKIPDRGRRVKALGNAVVPHCAYVAGMRLRARMGQ